MADNFNVSDVPEGVGPKSVDIPGDIADGVDGELLTWDAGGIADVTGPGTAGQVLTSNGPGAKPTFQAGGSGASDEYILIQDQKASGTDGGAFSPADTFLTRDLNTIVVDTGSHVVSVTADQIELDAGTYRCKFRAPANDIDVHFARLRNVTDGATLIQGSNTRQDGNRQIPATGWGRFTIAAAKKLEVQHICSTAELSSFGWGFENEQAGFVEIYTQIEFWKEQ